MLFLDKPPTHRHDSQEVTSGISISETHLPFTTVLQYTVREPHSEINTKDNSADQSKTKENP